MEVAAAQGAMAMESAKTAMSADIAMLKKSMDIEKDMAGQLLETMPKVNHDAPPGQQVRMLA